MTRTRDRKPGPCECGHEHIHTTTGRPSCAGHSKKTGRPCSKLPMVGQRVCGSHGGKAPQNIAAASRAIEQAKAEAEVRKLVPDNPDPVRDPIATLARLAGEADAVRTSVVAMLNELAENDLFTIDKHGAYQLHALVTLYEKWWTNTAKSCEALVRSNYIERYGALQEAELSVLLAVVQHAVRLIPDATTRQAVTDDIVSGLRASQSRSALLAS